MFVKLEKIVFFSPIHRPYGIFYRNGVKYAGRQVVMPFF